MFDYITAVPATGSAVSLHRADGRAVVTAEGLIGPTAPREVVRNRPQGHGSINPTRWLGDRLITITGECWGSSAGDALARYDELTEVLAGSLDAPVTLQWQRGGGGVEQQTVVKLASAAQPVVGGGGRFLQYQVQLRAADPRNYDQTLVEVHGSTLSASGGGKSYPFTYPYKFNAVGGGAAVLLVDGAFPTPPILRVHGYCVDPIVRLESTGDEVHLVGEIAAGHYVEIDVANRSVTLDGATPALDLYDYELSRRFDLPTGPQTVQLESPLFDASARVDVLYRPARL